mmetsp:Transcript_24003/g.66636  ORF Transcript_24003/g.66636 Transcript_24003/m.66636 type:complete len:704 (+) Transcript_24003:189-2300(+)|eukprot:CAMPEP_0168728216 /NCGR_PEP_ID=MMETSP0724-20121128/5571_1 /TAXON_ID=265536 /ORGANISM="Amphiprora sp., Strain CCMP467" /LENGTH=703 /DNA_ID=CAMNT_0008775057 /DNA_START=130 /DNA_END=2244 /DNA_ORIENTATION=+
MMLLNGTTTCLSQFVSLSLVLQGEENDAEAVQMVSPILLSGPLASLSQLQSLSALQELHFHLNSTIKAATEASTDSDDHIAMSFFKEDARQMEDVQLFSPLGTAGVGLYYRLIRTDKKAVVAKIANIVMMANKNNANAALSSLDGIWGFLICVGVTGLPLVTMPSNLFYHLSERVSDCKEILTRRGDLDVNSVKTLLSTILLFEDDSRMTNARIESIRQIAIAEPEESTTGKKVGLISPLGVRTKRSGQKTSDDQQNREDPIIPLDIPAAESTRLFSERIKVLSVAEGDTLLQKYTRPAFERKANLDIGGGSSKRRAAKRRSMTSRDSDFDNFDYKGPSRSGGSSLPALPLPGGAAAPNKMQSSFHSSTSSSKGTAGSRQLRQPAKDTKLKASILSAPRQDAGTGRRRGNAGGSSSNMDSDEMTATSGKFNPFGGSGQHQEDESVISQSRLQVNVALNEDLSCSYRSSQISSCSVEGVVQVQVRATAQTAPFYLLLRDPTEQVESFQENRRFADDVSDAILAEDDADRKYTISVPNGDNYFPVVRYKCVEDLRPVPIRVQTRAKTEGTHCRVALQISSNPNNEAKLTDLTIIMGVPDDIEGETLVTQPAGGVWNDAKRCVTWCVEELAEGEKFQLQARFQMAPGAPYDQNGEKPMFPVLVRCQCLFAQLSDLELEIREIPEIYPADVTMKIARRFRLSHRERA